MLIEQSNRMIGNKCGNIVEEVDKGQVILNTPTSYIDQPMLSAMQQMFNNANTPIHPQTMKPIYHQNALPNVYFNPL
jgi:nitrous oxide reductase accessory protein NosL